METELQTPGHAQGEIIHFPAADGLSLGGFLWAAPEAEPVRPLVIITAATSVRCRYYARFASYLFARGFDVLTYDYRGIGESRPAQLRGFQADWVDWGEKDLEGALTFAMAHRPGHPLFVVGHSIGGFAIGAAPSNDRIARILTVGAQFAYWRDYSPDRRIRMLLKWHLAMPLMAMVLGYVPAKRLGWMEDTPKGVALDWSRMRSRFEDTVRDGRHAEHGRGDAGLLTTRFANVKAPILAISLSDDPHGTVPAVDRLLAYFTGSPRLRLHLRPQDAGVAEIGHFAFFHDRFRETLWPLALAWLTEGQAPAGATTFPLKP
jgi:predicted alpha/beta hydrolase